MTLPLVVIAVVLAGVALAQAEAVRGMVHMWNNSPMYSYGWLVPIISLYLLWARRDRLAGLRLRPAPVAGGGLLIVWVLLLLAGRAGGVLLLEQLALVVAVAALVLTLLGSDWLRATWASIAYLLLAVPLWDGFTEPLHGRFQLLSADIGVRMLSFVGVPAFRTGTFIELPNITLEVARACSGVNYLVAVLALGLPLGYLYLRTMWRRVLLIGVALVIAAVSNSLRVALIGLLSYFDVGSPLHGPMHVLHGLFVAGIGHVALFVGLWWLSRQEDRRLGPAPAPAATASRVSIGWRSPSLRTALVVVAAVVWSGAALLFLYRPAPVPLAGPLAGLPSSLAGWTVDPIGVPTPPGLWKEADEVLERRYVLGDQAIDLFVGYFTQQRQAKELVSYRTNDLYRAARPLQIGLAGGDALAANAVLAGTGPDQRLTIFWYELDGIRTHERVDTKLRLLWHALGRRRTNGAVVSLGTTPGPEGAPTPEVRAFAAALEGALAACLPGRPAADIAARDVAGPWPAPVPGT